MQEIAMKSIKTIVRVSFVFFLLIVCAEICNAQAIEVVHLKNGFEAKGTITNRTESSIVLQTENGKTLTISNDDIESIGQENKAFDAKVLVGKWYCYKANGERDKKYDFVISENEGFYIVKYIHYLDFNSIDNTIKYYPHDSPDNSFERTVDVDIDDGNVSFHFWQLERLTLNSQSKRKRVKLQSTHCDIDLKYLDGKLKGHIDCIHYYDAVGCPGYDDVKESLDDGCGTVFADGPGGKWNVYFVKQ